jgi:hypothetical protein
LSYTEIELRIWYVSSASVPSAADHTLRSTAINNETVIDIAEIVRGYVDDVFDGDYSIDAPWCQVKVKKYNSSGTQIGADEDTVYSVLEGFPYFELGTNAEMSKSVMMTNNTIIANDLEAVTIPVNVENDTTFNMEKDGAIIYTESLSAAVNSEDVVKYIGSSIGDANAFFSRVTLDGGVIEAKQCVRDTFEEEYRTLDIDTIKVYSGSSMEVIKVKEIEECKYSPYKVTFKNVYGVWQDLWFFKKSKLSMKTKSESYNSHVLSAGRHNTSRHQYKTYSKNGKERIKLSSGYYPEDYNEVFREMQLSEQVYLTYNNQVLPVTVKDGDFSFKTKLNDKLISYELELEFAFDKINTIR